MHEEKNIFLFIDIRLEKSCLLLATFTQHLLKFDGKCIFLNKQVFCNFYFVLHELFIIGKPDKINRYAKTMNLEAIRSSLNHLNDDHNQDLKHYTYIL